MRHLSLWPLVLVLGVALIGCEERLVEQPRTGAKSAAMPQGAREEMAEPTVRTEKNLDAPPISGPEASVSGRVPLLNLRPREARDGGSSVSIRGTVPGVPVGQVRFHGARAGADILDVVCLAEIVQGEFVAEAPANGGEIFVSVVSLPATADSTGRLAFGVLSQALVLAGKDLDIEIALGSEASWTSRLAVPVDRLVTVSDVQPR